MNLLRSIALTIAAATFVWSCQQAQEQAEEKTEKRFREISELSAVMREIADKTKEMKVALASGQALEDHRSSFARILTAEPTNYHIKGDKFDPMAKAFLASLDKVYTDTVNSQSHYQNMVTVCENCHNMQCPGPLGLIKGLKAQ